MRLLLARLAPLAKTALPGLSLCNPITEISIFSLNPRAHFFSALGRMRESLLADPWRLST